MKDNRLEQTYKYNWLLAMKQEVEHVFLPIPGMVCVTVGAKVTGGIVTGEICFRVYVNNKKRSAGIPGRDRIPRFIYGIATDVNEYPKNFSATADNGEYRPLVGGSSIFSSRGLSSGTLGCMVVDDATKAVMMLTCFHVLAANGESKGHEVGQPDFCCDRSWCRCGQVAKFERGFWGDKNVDCAVAKLSNGNENNWTNDVLELGSVTSIPLDEFKDPVDPATDLTTLPDGSLVRPVLVNDTLFMRGKESGMREGIVLEITGNTYDVNFKTKDGVVTKNFKNQLVVRSKVAGEKFAVEGDSGAVLLNHLNQVVGLVFAGGEFQLLNGTRENVALANPIQDVLKILEITIADTTIEDILPLRSSFGEIHRPRVKFLDELVSRAVSVPSGSLLVVIIKKHHEEVIHLINSDRETKVTWNRFKGPQFAARFFDRIKNAGHPIPLEIEGISWQRLLTKMSVVLENKGSPGLIKDIEIYSTKTFGFVKNLIRIFNNDR